MRASKTAISVAVATAIGAGGVAQACGEIRADVDAGLVADLLRREHLAPEEAKYGDDGRVRLDGEWQDVIKEAFGESA